MKYLRCMAYHQDGVYVAACLDLSLAAQADSMKEAMDKLEQQIDALFDEVKEEPQYAKDLLLNRKAPLSLWFKYWFIALKMLFSKKSGKASLFNEPCKVTC